MIPAYSKRRRPSKPTRGWEKLDQALGRRINSLGLGDGGVKIPGEEQ